MFVILKNTIVHLLHLLLRIGFIIGENCVSVVNLKGRTGSDAQENVYFGNPCTLDNL